MFVRGAVCCHACYTVSNNDVLYSQYEQYQTLKYCTSVLAVPPVLPAESIWYLTEFLCAAVLIPGVIKLLELVHTW